MKSENKNRFGIPALKKLYKPKRKDVITVITITVIVVIPICVFSKSSSFDLLNSVVSLIINVIPALLGFVLSGFALLIGFSSFEHIAKQKKEGQPTLYLKISTIFTISLLFQFILLIIGILYRFAIDAKIFISNETFVSVVNYGSVVLLFALFIYVLFLTKDLVVVVFNYSLLQHYQINPPKSDTKNSKDDLIS